MKQTILKFGLISGVLASLFMLATIPFIHDLEHGSKGLIVGYTGMVLSFLLVFFGIRSYRDNLGAGQITFGRAFTIGISITLIMCAFYVVTWEILYFNFMHNFMDQYAVQAVEKLKTSGASAAAIQAQIEQMRRYKESVLYNSAFTFIEPFPLGLLITLISAAVLRKKPSTQPPPHLTPITD